MIKLVFAAVLSVTCTFVAAQLAPGKISYQAVVRDTQGNELVDQSVSVNFTIHKSSSDGEVVYSENHNLVQTDQFGLFSTLIGDGIPTGQGIFNSLGEIQWETDDYFLEVSAGQPGSIPQVVGVSQILAVPYSYYSTRAGSVVNEADGDTQNELIDDFTMNGTTLELTEQGVTFGVDLSSVLTENLDDELISQSYLSADHLLTIQENDHASMVNLSSIAYATWNENQQSVFTTNQSVGINTPNAQSTLQVNGSFAVGVSKINTGVYDLNSDLTLANKTVIIGDVAAGDIQLLLMPASSCAGRTYKFRKFFQGALTANDLTVTPFAGETIDGLTSYVMDSNTAEYLTIISDGQDWYVIDHYHE
ncbi:MAG: hypothetical protein ACK5BL_04330 [Flavobacteriales bacterium]|jgi:hypothetical protein